MSSALFREFVAVVYDSNQSRAAEALSLDRSTVSRLCSGDRKVTPDVALEVERLSDGRFRKEALVWPDSEEAA